MSLIYIASFNLNSYLLLKIFKKHSPRQEHSIITDWEVEHLFHNIISRFEHFDATP